MAQVKASVKVGDRGRFVLPSALRQELNLKEGTWMLLSTELDGSLRLRPYRAVADDCIGLLADIPGSMANKLIAERQAESAQEDSDRADAR
jgi:AbrB family looped-hinge helix DNA binding protein